MTTEILGGYPKLRARLLEQFDHFEDRGAVTLWDEWRRVSVLEDSPQKQHALVRLAAAALWYAKSLEEDAHAG